MCKSLLKEIRFTIGEQYELNEFNLKALESDFSNGIEYENYEYIKGDFNVLFGIPFSRNVILQYNGDILYSVIFSFDVLHYREIELKVKRCINNEISLGLYKEGKSNCKLIVKKV